MMIEKYEAQHTSCKENFTWCLKPTLFYKLLVLYICMYFLLDVYISICQVTQGVSEFKPTPSENRDCFKSSYNVKHTLLVCPVPYIW